MSTVLRVLVVLALTLTACSAPSVSLDGGPLDAPPFDTGPLDLGPPDAPSVGDGGPDAGPPEITPTTCERASLLGSAYGCEHYVVDLDNAALGVGSDSSALTFAILVTNPQLGAASVVVERDTAAVGATPVPMVVATVTVAPSSTQTISLGRAEVDGASATGMDDGTHTALSANAFHVTSDVPVAVHQLNPLETGAGFSSDGTLVLPVHALSTRYGIAAWPQTLATTSDPMTNSSIDLRTFLTVVGTAPATHVQVTLGPNVVHVLGAGAIPASGPGDVITADLGAFEVLNLETDGFHGDFTGSAVQATSPVAVFVGAEAADVPVWSTSATRSCCADHLETELTPADRAGRHFVITRATSRAALLAHARDPSMPVMTLPSTEYLRILAVEPGTTTLDTSLTGPLAHTTLAEGTLLEVPADHDFTLTSDHRLVVLQALPSQGATGVDIGDPGGDPSLYSVSAVEHYVRDVAFAIPPGYLFDEILITAPTGHTVLLDGDALPPTCDTADISADWTAIRCHMSAPAFTAGPAGTFTDGVQHDGFHRVTSTAPLGVVVTGFSFGASYAFVAGEAITPP